MQDDYIESRLDPQIKYYDKRSTRCHNEHNYLSIFGIILTAAIPPLTLLSIIRNRPNNEVLYCNGRCCILHSVQHFIFT